MRHHAKTAEKTDLLTPRALRTWLRASQLQRSRAPRKTRKTSLEERHPRLTWLAVIATLLLGYVAVGLTLAAL